MRVLFHDALIMLDYIAANDRLTEFRRIRRYAFDIYLRNNPRIFLERLRKTMKSAVRTEGISPEIKVSLALLICEFIV